MSGLIKRPIYTSKNYASYLDDEMEIVVDKPAQFVSRITLNQPDLNNKMGHAMRAQLFNQLQINDQDPDVRVTIIRGAGENFCSGQDFGRSKGALPMFTDESDGQLQRNNLQGWFMIMDLAKPVIAQVHGECLGSGMELAAACDIVYVAEDAQVGYPPVRNMGLPDMQIYPWLCGMRNALSIMLLAETMSGDEAVYRGWATKSFPVEQLDAATLDIASRVAKIPADLLAYNKRSVHRAFEAQGMRANLRHGVDMESLMFHSPSGGMLTRSVQDSRRSGPPRRSPAAARSPATSNPTKPPSAIQPSSASAKPPMPTNKAVQQKATVSSKPPTQSPSKAIGSALVAAGMQIHIHEPVTIHVHQEVDDSPVSKL